jgi:hypothetical protein
VEFLRFDNIVINVGAIADAEFESDAELPGHGTKVERAPRLTVRYLAVGTNGFLLNRVFHGADARRVLAHLDGLCARGPAAAPPTK